MVRKCSRQWPDYHWTVKAELYPPYNNHNLALAGLFALRTYIPLRRKAPEVILVIG